MTKKKERPTGIQVDLQNGEVLRFLVGDDRPAWAKKIIGKLLEDRIMATRRPGQMPAESLAPAAELLAELRKEVDALHEALQDGRLPSWRAYAKAHPPSPEAIALLVIVGHEALVKWQTGKGAGKTNAPKADAKAWMLKRWRDHGHEFESKTKFAENFQPILKREMGQQVTVKTVVDRWLKGL